MRTQKLNQFLNDVTFIDRKTEKRLNKIRQNFSKWIKSTDQGSRNVRITMKNSGNGNLKKQKTKPKRK